MEKEDPLGEMQSPEPRGQLPDNLIKRLTELATAIDEHLSIADGTTKLSAHDGHEVGTAIKMARLLVAQQLDLLNPEKSEGQQLEHSEPVDF